jgi:catechol 2,3-dioxygenase-like lactoylglutathione lyase family enzyme
MPRDMGIQRMDHVGMVVDDFEAAIAFFAELGLELLQAALGRFSPLEMIAAART